MSNDNDRYYSQSRPEMLQFIPEGTQRLLDIGCGDGRFGEGVKCRFPNCETWGVEPETSAAAEAAKRNDKVLNASIEAVGDLPQGFFDVVTMNDVLEHLYHSEPVLEAIKGLLKPNGCLILSLPNVRFYLNVRDLLFHTDWEYKDFGILDRTHVKFFTRKSAERLLEENGYRVLKAVGINGHRLKLHYRTLFALAPKFFEGMREPQFAIVAVPVNEG